MDTFRAVLIGDGDRTVDMPAMAFVWSGTARYDTVSLIVDAISALARLHRKFNAIL